MARARINRDRLDEEQRKKKAKLLRQFSRRFRDLFLNERGRRRLLAISDAEWKAAQEESESAT